MYMCVTLVSRVNIDSSTHVFEYLNVIVFYAYVGICGVTQCISMTLLSQDSVSFRRLSVLNRSTTLVAFLSVYVWYKAVLVLTSLVQ